MEKLMKRENILVEYSPQGVSTSSGKTQHRSSETDDMDFNDVFGGPPRRFSMQDVRERYSFGETTESEEEKSPWGVREKPVFGDEIVARRRRKGEDFYDDIFGGEESRKNSPSSSRVMSPVRSFTPKAEPYGTSLPSQFSLTPKLAKAGDHAVFGSRNSNQYKTYNSNSGLNSPHSSSNSLSRFSNRATHSQDGARNELHHQSVLSREGSLSSEEDLVSDEKGKTDKLKRGPQTTDQFHFSIYKWAGSGVPMLVMPVIGRNNLKSKGIKGKYDEMEIDHVKGEHGHVEHIHATNQSFSVETEKKELKIKEIVNKEKISTEGAAREIPESKSQSKGKSTIGFGKATNILKSKKLKSVDAVDVKEKVEGEMPKTIKDFMKSAEVKRTGTVADIKENVVKTAKGASSSDHSITNVDKNTGPANDSKRQNVGKSNLQDGTINSGTTTSKSGVKGKVKGFVQIFSQETDTKPKADFEVRTQSFRSKAAGIFQKESEVSSTAANMKQNVNLHTLKKPDILPKVDENMKDKAQTPNKITSNRYNDVPTKQNNVTSAESLNRHTDIPVDYPDDTSEDNFVVEELFDDQENRAQSATEGSDDLKALDAKIQQWSVGKKGNIRSLLSTLQYVLWPESGWIAVPLVDLIEGNSVKRAYQKALLRLHPDKLQQKGAADSHKYIAQKVFDILQEAWDHFNTIAPL